MNAKLKLTLGIIGLAVILGGSAWLYHTLSGQYAQKNNGLETDDAASEKTAGTSETSGSETAEGTTQETAGETAEPLPAPDFTVTDYDDNVINFSDFRGRPVVINFWASWCPPCKSELPTFHNVQEQLGGDIAFMMIDVTDGIRETKEDARELIDEKGYTFPVYYDTELDASNTYGVTSLPSTVFIDSDGNIATGYTGMIDEATLLRGISMIYSP